MLYTILFLLIFQTDMVITLSLDSLIMDFTLLREQKYVGNTWDIENLCLIGGISGGQVVKEVRKVRNTPLSAPSFKTK